MKIELWQAGFLLLPWIFGQTTAQLGALQANTIQPVVSVFPTLYAKDSPVPVIVQQTFRARVFSALLISISKTINLMVLAARTVIVRMYGVQN